MEMGLEVATCRSIFEILCRLNVYVGACIDRQLK